MREKDVGGKESSVCIRPVPLVPSVSFSACAHPGDEMARLKLAPAKPWAICMQSKMRRPEV